MGRVSAALRTDECVDHEEVRASHLSYEQKDSRKDDKKRWLFGQVTEESVDAAPFLWLFRWDR